MEKIGRNRTIILSGVEKTMSDIDRIVYIDINNYKSALLKELKELGLIKLEEISSFFISVFECVNNDIKNL